MKRFLTLLGIAAVAGAVYVATAPGGLRSTPTPAQWKAMTAKVTKLQRQVTNLKKEADAALGVELLCIMHKPVAVDQSGGPTSGYLFGPPQTAPNAVTATASSALNLAPSTETSPQHRFFELNTSQSACVKISNSAGTLTAEKRSVATFSSGG